jgi:hypothetical protein
MIRLDKISKQIQNLENSVKRIIKDKKLLTRYILIFLLIIYSCLVFPEAKKFIIIILLIVINLVSAFAKRFLIKQGISNILKGFEFVMFTTVITGYTYGIKIGMIMGGLCMVINYISENRFSMYFIMTIPLYMLFGYIAARFNNIPIITLGIILTLVYNLMTVFIGMGLMGAKARGILIFSLTNILFNVYLFSILGEPVIKLIS